MQNRPVARPLFEIGEQDAGVVANFRHGNRVWVVLHANRRDVRAEGIA